MNDRPPIPAELRRRILVEAGHRCAIHTCRYPKVDVHHIVPWERCRAHSYDNLIALCPNCHRRADAGEIDRNALRLYKARLTASFGISNAGYSPYGTALRGPTSDAGWQTEAVRERNEDHPLYELELEFPRFIGTGPDFEDLNLLQQGNALARLCDFRALRLRTAGADADPWATVPSTLTASYEVSCCSEFIISIRYSMFHYGAGAAHPNHWTDVVNVQLNPLVTLNLGSLFRLDAPYLQIVSEYCIRDLCEQKGLAEPSREIKKGAGLDHSNFLRFNVTRSGLLLTFDEYEVDCYAAGGSQVNVPKDVLLDHLNPACRITNLWT